VNLLSEQTSYIGYQAIINAKFTAEVKWLSIVHVAGRSNVPGLVYSIYQHETSFLSAGLNCTTLESRLTHSKLIATTSVQRAKLRAGKKNRAKERRQTKRQENVAFNKTYDHDHKPERCESKPQVKRDNFLPWTASQKQPIPVGKKWGGVVSTASVSPTRSQRESEAKYW
jgi:hypothetical protein